MADEADPIECSAQPLGLSFHPTRRIAAAGLVDGTLELHDFSDWPERMAKKKDIRLSKSTSRGATSDCTYGNGDDEGDGTMEQEEDEDDTIFASLPIHVNDTSVGASSRSKPSCRSVLFSDDGTRLYAAGNGGGLSALDAEMISSSSSSVILDDSRDSSGLCRGELWRIDGASPNAINCLFQMPQCSPAGRLLVTGDDEGVVRLWDDRMCGGDGNGSAKSSVAAAAAASGSKNGASFPRGCVMSWSDQNDYISCFDSDRDGKTLLASSAGCTLGVYDIRKSAVNSSKPNKGPTPRLSDDQEDELLSVAVIKNGRKVVCGTGEGVLAVWSWGTWGDVSDRFPGHPNSIEALLKVDEDTILTGSSDGLIRIVQIQPDKLLGVLGEHDGFPVESLRYSSRREYVSSLSHDALIRMWDASLLHDNDDDDNDSDEDSEDERKGEIGDAVDVMKKAGAGLASDDEWDDEDDSVEEDTKPSANKNREESDDSDSDSENSDSDEDGRGGKKPRLFKTEAEKFFEDL
mmetsp:Transcript_36155/g.79135  ORF Transcript_36155/g.79135 Transcript_36155/m.79135 type:complete len:518 (+) Transcript_36155:63-1616(+)